VKVVHQDDYHQRGKKMGGKPGAPIERRLKAGPCDCKHVRMHVSVSQRAERDAMASSKTEMPQLRLLLNHPSCTLRTETLT